MKQCFECVEQPPNIERGEPLADLQASGYDVRDGDPIVWQNQLRGLPKTEEGGS